MEMNWKIKRINWYSKKARIITTVCKPQVWYTTHVVQGYPVGGVVVLRKVGKLGFLQSDGYVEVDLFGPSWNSSNVKKYG